MTLSCGSGRSGFGQEFGDLNGVRRRAFADVVGDHPHGDAVVQRGITADPPHEHLVPALRVYSHRVGAARRVVGHDNARRGAKNIPRLIRRDGIGELHVDGL